MMSIVRQPSVRLLRRMSEYMWSPTYMSCVPLCRPSSRCRWFQLPPWKTLLFLSSACACGVPLTSMLLSDASSRRTCLTGKATLTGFLRVDEAHLARAQGACQCAGDCSGVGEGAGVVCACVCV